MKIKSQKVFKIGSYSDLEQRYSSLIPDPTGNTLETELLCLFNYLLKNNELKAIERLCQFPYTVMKRESPDFEIRFADNEKLMMELTTITTNKNEVMSAELSKNKGYCAEVTKDNYSDDRPKKGETQKNIKKPGEEFTEEGLYGYYPEIQWARIVANTIRKKAKKDYAENVDILLLYNRLPNVNENLHIGIESFRKNNSKHEHRDDMPVFPAIVADSTSSIVVLRKDWKWEYKLMRRKMQ